MNWGFGLAFVPYGPTWRKQRKIYQQTYRPDAVRKYQGVQAEKVNDFLNLLLTEPEDFMSHIRQYVLLGFAAGLTPLTSLNS